MKTALKTIGLLCIVTLFVACEQNTAPTPYKITGEYISMLPEASEDSTKVSEASTDETEDTEEEVDEPIDLSNAMLTISYETTDTNGETETVTLYEESFQGNFEYENETLQPTELKISLRISDDTDAMEINAIVGTGHDIHVALIDHPSPNNAEFVLAGTISQAMDSENKFVVSGDLSFLEENLSNDTTVLMYTSVIDDDGNRSWQDWGPVLVQDNSFLIEGVVEEPVVATLTIRGSSESDSYGYYGSSSLILEPQGEFEVAQLGNQTDELGITSGTEYHSMLIESWQQNEEYIELVDAWASEFARFINPPDPSESEKNEAETLSDENGGDTAVEAEVADLEEDTEGTEKSKIDTKELVSAVKPAEGCEDAVEGVSQQSASGSPAHRDTPKHVTLRQRASEIRTKTLRTIVEDGANAQAQYLAMLLRPYSDDTERLSGWQSLAEKFDEEFVASRIKPEIDFLHWISKARANDAALIPGQRVPEFTLANASEEDVALYDLLGENDLVLIDFWASWCGPCIGDFPELKKLHTAYADEEFEIVGVSIDSEMEDWIGGLEEHELPWINLGELKDWEGPVATSYGVTGIPKGFLVDSQGCIYKKNIRPAALKEFLVNRYGMDESLDEPELDTDDSQGVSG